MKSRVYLAGPEVFLRNALEVGARKKDLCAAYGYKPGRPLWITLGKIFR